MKKLGYRVSILALCFGLLSSAQAQTAPAAPAASAASAAPAEPAAEITCFESRKGASEVVKRDLKPGHPNVKCSTRTGAVLWWGDPFDGTVPMGEMPLMEKYAGKAVVKPRSDKLPLLAMCGTACHNGVGPKFVPPTLPTTRKPVPIPTMEGMLPDAKNFQHGRGGIWCLDCHHTTQRNKLVDNFGDPVSIRTAATAVRQVPRRQAARLARRHPWQAHRRMGQHRQETLVHLHRVPQPAQRAGRRAATAASSSLRLSRRRSCPGA